MAKLSAHGSEVARLHRNFPRPQDPDFASEDVYLSLRTDGFVLERRALNWRDRHERGVRRSFEHDSPGLAELTYAVFTLRLSS